MALRFRTAGRLGEPFLLLDIIVVPWRGLVLPRVHVHPGKDVTSLGHRPAPSYFGEPICLGLGGS